MPTLLKIGYDYYLIKEANAAKVINAMAGCVKLRRDYQTGAGSKDRYYPEEHQDEIGMVTIRQEQILPCKPGAVDITVAPNQKQISISAPLRLSGE